MNNNDEKLLKVEKILKGSLDLILSPSRSCEHLNFCFHFFWPLLGIVNKLCCTKSLLTTPSNVWSKKWKKKFKCSQLLEGDRIESRLPSKIFSTLPLWSPCVLFNLDNWFHIRFFFNILSLLLLGLCAFLTATPTSCVPWKVRTFVCQPKMLSIY